MLMLYCNVKCSLKTLVLILLGCFYIGFFGVSVSYAGGSKTVISYEGQPVPSAMAPSMSAFSQDVCGIGISGAINGGIFSVAGGTMVTDTNCVKLKWAKFLHDSGLKVAAVSLACGADKAVWEALEMSGSPCPIGGAIGDAARRAWYEIHPEWFYDIYGKNFTFPLADNRSE
jgi:hypothetical protein